MRYIVDIFYKVVNMWGSNSKLDSKIRNISSLIILHLKLGHALQIKRKQYYA